MNIRVYYEDTDCGNVVYYANYLRYMERSRTEHLRDKGVDLSEYHQQGIMFVVAEAHIYYNKPAVYNDLLEVDSRIRKISAASMIIETIIKRVSGPQLVTGEVKLACINKKGKVNKIPEAILEILK